MDQQAIANLDRNFGQVFVAAMHRVARLECGDPRPAALEEHGPCLGRAMVKTGVGLREVTFR